MKAILLAAGLGTRLQPITNSVPKCLVLINGTPLLKIWLEKLLSAGIEKVLINTHYLPDLVEDFITQYEYRSRVVLLHEYVLLGTAGTLFANRDFIGNEPIIVVHADNLSNFDINDFMRAHQNRPLGCNMTMMLFKTDNPKSCGIVELDERGIVVGFHEKTMNPPSTLANAAVYIFEPDLISEFHCMSPRVTDISTEIIPQNLGRIFTYLNTRYHRDIGTPENLWLANIEYKNLHDNY